MLPFYLTRSKLRRDLLTLFFLNPGQSYYLRELERRLGASPGTLARELKAFSNDGLLSRQARGREVFYQINHDHPLFSEIKAIVEKTVGIPARISEGFQKMKEVRSAYVYGSLAQEKMTADSDIDLLIVGKETDGLNQFLKTLEAMFGREVNATVYSQNEFDRKRKDKSEFIYEVMKSPLIQLKP